MARGLWSCNCVRVCLAVSMTVCPKCVRACVWPGFCTCVAPVRPLSHASPRCDLLKPAACIGLKVLLSLSLLRYFDSIQAAGFSEPQRGEACRGGGAGAARAHAGRVQRCHARTRMHARTRTRTPHAHARRLGIEKSKATRARMRHTPAHARAHPTHARAGCWALRRAEPRQRRSSRRPSSSWTASRPPSARRSWRWPSTLATARTEGSSLNSGMVALAKYIGYRQN